MAARSRELGNEEFLPAFRAVRALFGRRNTLELPLFPGYVLAGSMLRKGSQL